MEMKSLAYAYFFLLAAILEIQIAAAIMGCDFCLGSLCLVRTKCPAGAENLFMITDVDFDYNNNIMYTVNNTLRALYFDDGGVAEIPTNTGNHSIVSLAVDRRTSDVYYSTSASIFAYEPISNVTTQVYFNSYQHQFVSVWVHRRTVFFKIITAGLYYLLPRTPEARKVNGLDGVFVENVAFDSSGVAYISSSENVYRIKEKKTMRAAEFLTGHYAIAADRTGDMYFSTNRRLYLLDKKTDELKLIGVFAHHVSQILFDSSNYIIMEDQGKMCSHYKPVPDHCTYDVSVDSPEITKVS